MSYSLNNGFNLYANGAAAVLAGASKYSNTIANTTNLGTSTTLNTSGSTMIVVPELEAKLGFNFTYTMAQGDLIFDAAWMWINYFNPVQSDTYGLTPMDSNFGLQGPIFGLKWLGNVA